MGTRATYQFKTEGKYAHLEPTSTIYVHWDGYPKGAAAYFYATLVHPSKGCMATQFIRAVDIAELTKSHDVHGDTEFRYTLVGTGPDATLKAEATEYDSDYKLRTCRPIFTGPLRSFIDDNHSMIENYHPFHKVHRNYGCGQWLNLDTARLQLEAEHGVLRTLRVWEKNGDGPSSSNWRGQVEALRHLVEVFPELRTEEVDRYLATVPATV